jgi:hypothetical protein
MQWMATDRWMEVAEARRVRQLAQLMPMQPLEPTRLSVIVLMAKLRSMNRLAQRRLAYIVTRSPL